jgi:hypothetical protein
VNSFVASSKPNDERNLPTVFIDVPKKNIDALDGLEPGNAVRVILEGTVVEVSQRKIDVEGGGFSGTLKVEVKRVAARKVDNSFSELMDDD